MSDKKKTNKKSAPKKAAPVKKIVPVYKTFLYLIPEGVSAAEMSAKLEFLPEEAMEVWTEINVLEITVDARTITFESLMEDLYEEDMEVLNEMGMKQVYTCEYAAEDSAMMQKVMQTLTDAFGGKIGSDTDDFEPFMSVAEL